MRSYLCAKKSLRIIFAGTPEFAAEHLKTIIKSNHNVIGVFTKPDNLNNSRNNSKKQNPVKMLALQNNIPVFQPYSFVSDMLIKIEKMKVDLIIVVAYGLIFPTSILNLPIFGAINIHGSILPRWRGASPIQYAILSGDKITGITVIKMNSDIDGGDIICQKKCKIEFFDNSESLYKKILKISLKVMIIVINKISLGKFIKTTAQDESKVTYSKKINKKQARLNWLKSASILERHIRAFIPWPVSYFYIKKKLIKVFEAEVLPHQINKKPGEIILANKKGIQIATKNGVLNITKIQLFNRKIMKSSEFLNAKKYFFSPGDIIE